MSNVNGYHGEESLLSAAKEIASLAEYLSQIMQNKKEKAKREDRNINDNDDE